MGLPGTGLRIRFSRSLWVPALAAVLAAHGAAQPSAPNPDDSQEAADADQVIGGLRQVSKELIDAVKSLRKHVDDALAQYDHGYRTGDGKQVQGADADLSAGPADIVAAAVRKSMLARILAANGPGYNPVPSVDARHIQDLISEASRRIEASDALLRRLLVVSVKGFDSRKQAEWKGKHDQLLKARSAAEEAAKKALVALPIDLPEGESEQERKDQAWDLLVQGRPAPQETSKEVRRVSLQKVSPKLAKPLPAGVEPYKRITLVHDLGYRLALTDSGMEDRAGRHVFYQEQWIQRGMTVLRMRWRVGVETKTGQHVLIKRYRPRELRGEIDDLYNSGRDYLWYLEPPEESAEPSRQEMESALEQVAHSRDEIRAAVQDYKNAIRSALTRNESVLDPGLPDALRERLFAIRGHLLGAPAVLEPEERVWHAVEKADDSIQALEPLAAWANRSTPDQESPTSLSAPEWERFEERSDSEIDVTHTVGRQALASLPPKGSEGTAKFPPLDKDVVVHILRQRIGTDPAISLLQDLWRVESWGGGPRRVQRTATVVSIDSTTGNQKLVSGTTKYYTARPDDTLEEIYEQYAGQDLPLEAVRK